MSQMDFHEAASLYLKVLLAKKRMTYSELAQGLAKLGIEETTASIKGKLHRGTFSFAWLLACCNVLKVTHIDFEDQGWDQDEFYKK